MHFKRYHLIFSIGITVTLLSCQGNRQPAPGSSTPGVAPLTVSMLILRTGDVENKILSTGTLLANEEVELRSEVPGRIREIYFEEGSFVRKGTLMVKIEDEELQAQLKKLLVEEQEAGDDVYRKQKLLDLKALSQEEFDKAANQLAMVQADIELKRSQLAKTEILAPFDGQVGLREVSPGEYLSPSTAIAMLQQVDPIKIEFTIPEKYGGLVHKGSVMNFTVAGKEQVFTGKIYAIEPKIDPSTRNITLRAVCANPSKTLMPGAFAKVELILEEVPDALMIPSEAIIPTIEGEKVYVSHDGKASSVMITTGIRTEREVQVINGLHPGDSLITSGLLQLREMMPVLPKPQSE